MLAEYINANPEVWNEDIGEEGDQSAERTPRSAG
jgi:hypothetical protein